MFKSLLPVKLLILYKKLFEFKAVNERNSVSVKNIFENYYKDNRWGSSESVSGPGSEEKYTEILIPQINKLFNDFNIRSVLDIPCGDFNWMKNVDLQNKSYIGADIVEEMITLNISKYKRETLNFKVLDLINDDLPEVDLIICRDCLVHFSYENIQKAFHQIKKSGSKYLLTTTFPQFPGNYNIPTGKWRPLNLEKSPFKFSKPIFAIDEKKVNDVPNFYTKILALWEIDKLKI
ncbi:MAG TPA: class I SAM-dependent methyltransferase [Bacteroidia bacterium]|nr:class I SAM-dependent methyltransferase [Bacteroidia bacterium]